MITNSKRLSALITVLTVGAVLAAPLATLAASQSVDDTLRAHGWGSLLPQSLDYDGDGLPNTFEQTIGTNQFRSDSDGDGYSDAEEILNGYNPVGPGRAGNLDVDGDGLTFDQEMLVGTDPLSKDSDLDGYNDGQEYFSQHNPLGKSTAKFPMHWFETMAFAQKYGVTLSDREVDFANFFIEVGNLKNRSLTPTQRKALLAKFFQINKGWDYRGVTAIGTTLASVQPTVLTTAYSDLSLILGRKLNPDDATDSRAIQLILSSEKVNRRLDSEQVALTQFRARLHRMPANALEWRVVQVAGSLYF